MQVLLVVKIANIALHGRIVICKVGLMVLPFEVVRVVRPLLLHELVGVLGDVPAVNVRLGRQGPCTRDRVLGVQLQFNTYLIYGL